MDLSPYINGFYEKVFSKKSLHNLQFPWEILDQLEQLLLKEQLVLNRDSFNINGNIAIHKTAIIEEYVILKGVIIISEGCLVKSGSYVRNSIFLGKNVSIGPNCEIKQSIICEESRIAHLNYVGNSILGEDVNIEGGAILANHFNEREDKEVAVLLEGKKIMTKTNKFGSLLGDRARIGANSVLNPGTILRQDSVVERLTHLDQLSDYG